MSDGLSARPRLLVISSAPGQRTEDGIRLDRKFAEGMRHYASAWAGPTGCLLREQPKPLPFSDIFDPEALPFRIHLRPAGHRIGPADLDDYDVVLCSGDNQDYLHVAALCHASGKAVFFTIEYIPETRRQIVRLDPGRSALRKLKSILHIQHHERRRRRAFALAAGLQANGYPAAGHYRRINPNTILYLDNRIDAQLLATGDEMAQRRAHLSAGGPLRLIHSGRLEPMKGSQDLVPVPVACAISGSISCWTSSGRAASSRRSGKLRARPGCRTGSGCMASSISPANWCPSRAAAAISI